MSEVSAGHVLLAFPRGDEGLQSVIAEVLELAAGREIYLLDRLEDVHQSFSNGGEYPFHHQVLLLGTPYGYENAASSHLYQLFARVSYQQATRGDPYRLITALQGADPPFYASPNELWSTSASGAAAHAFNLLSAHNDALALLGPAAPVPGTGVWIGILDTGLDKPYPAGTNITAEFNAMDYDEKANSTNVEDGTGHGTLVTTLIASVVSGADYKIAKAFNNSGCSTDWHLLVGLSLLADCDVINISVESQLAGEHFRCKAIGHAATSAVFQAVLQRGIADSSSIYVAAAGNGGLDDLAYPARFDQVVAIASINENGSLSHFSNRISNAAREPHSWVFVAPGGDHADDGSVAEEALAETQDGRRSFYGTSFATAYATGVVVAHIVDARAAQGLADRDDILDRLKSTADSGQVWYTSEHGHGLVQLPKKVPAVIDQFRALKHLGIEDPDLDMFLAIDEGDIPKLQKALDAGADVNITTGEVLGRYQDRLEGRSDSETG